MTVEELKGLVEKYTDRYQYVGVRTQEEPFELGEVEHRSSVWVDVKRYGRLRWRERLKAPHGLKLRHLLCSLCYVADEKSLRN